MNCIVFVDEKHPPDAPETSLTLGWLIYTQLLEPTRDGTSNRLAAKNAAEEGRLLPRTEVLGQRRGIGAVERTARSVRLVPPFPCCSSDTPRSRTRAHRWPAGCVQLHPHIELTSARQFDGRGPTHCATLRRRWAARSRPSRPTQHRLQICQGQTNARSDRSGACRSPAGAGHTSRS